MRSTFRVLFYTKNQAIKNGRVPVMGRITVNGTTASFSCKRDVPLALWDAKGNCAKGKSDEARRLNQDLDNIKAQIGRHYQYLSDHDSLLTAKKVYDRYNGFGDEVHSLMEIFDSQIEDYRRQIGRTKAESTYQGLVNDPIAIPLPVIVKSSTGWHAFLSSKFEDDLLHKRYPLIL